MSVPSVYVVPTEKTSPVFCDAFRRGCGASRLVDDGQLRPGPVALWGSPSLWPLLTQARAEGRTWYYGDNGYFGRGDYFRVTRNALQHDGRGDGDARRFAQFGLNIKPWRNKGVHIVICPNSPTFFQLHGLKVEHWLGEVIAVLSEHTDRPMRIRWKKRAKSYPLAEDLKNAWATVNYSSNSAVEGLIEGIPCFSTADHAAAYRMGSPDLTLIESPVAPSDPERQRFLHALAANQWTLDEIRRGLAWDAVREREAAHA